MVEPSATHQAAPRGEHGLIAPSARGRSLRRIGDVIVDLGFATREEVEGAVNEARDSGRNTGKVLMDRGTVGPEELARAVAERFGLDYLDLTAFDVDMGAANLIDPSAARRFSAVPVAFVNERTVLVAMSDPSNIIAIDDLAMMIGREIRPAVASAEDIATLVGRLSSLDFAVEELEHEADSRVETVELHESADQAPVIKLVRSIIAQAVDRGASDIHFEPHNGGLTVRFRIDGLAVDSATVPSSLTAGVISRIKIMAGLDIAERRIPQDGRVGVSLEGREIDLRVVTLPLVAGESAVMRILDSSSARLDLNAIGMRDYENERLRRSLNRTYGAILVTGPTGSGKTTTLYAGLHAINTREKTILTIEDPVEYHLDGIKQIQVNARTGLTFPAGLRAMLRADPDVLMVGEIRDHETARTAIEAALTGHLLLSTLHTNTAAGAIPRLIDMGTEPFLVASAVDCVVAQRLVRTLCEYCKQREVLGVDMLRANGYTVEEPVDAYKPVGCSRCTHSGYRGRTGLYEVLSMTEELRELAVRRESADVLAAAARKQGMRFLRDDGLAKVRLGLSSAAEVTRVVGT